jgi:rubrerythrin
LSEITPAIKKEINRVIPNGAKVGDVFQIPNRGMIVITEEKGNDVVNYTFYDEPSDIERLTQLSAKNVAKKAADDAAKQLKISTNVKNLQESQEKNMVSETEPTEIDFIKQEKIKKQQQKEADVANAISIAAGLKDDIKQIKDVICEGPNCKFNTIDNKFDVIEDKIKKLDEKSVDFFVCEKCGYDRVIALTSFCPRCGAKIPSWSGDDGQPVPGWRPYWETNNQEE